MNIDSRISIYDHASVTNNNDISLSVKTSFPSSSKKIYADILSHGVIISNRNYIQQVVYWNNIHKECYRTYVISQREEIVIEL